MLHELLAYFAGSLMLFALSSKGWFTVIAITSLLTGAAVWWGCGVFGKLWYTPFTRRPIHWFWTVLASVFSILFVWLLAASAYVPQISAVSALVWRAELSFDEEWKAETFREVYDAVKEAGYEDFAKHPFEKGVVPTNDPESVRIKSKILADNAHLYFRERRPLLSRAYWSSPTLAAKKIEQRTNSFFKGEPMPLAGESSIGMLIDVGKQVPMWSGFLSQIDSQMENGGLLRWVLEGAGIDSAIGEWMKEVEEEVAKTEAKLAAGDRSTYHFAMDYAILANEIVKDALVKGDRVRWIVILCIAGLWAITVGLPLTMIGTAARREADLSLHQNRRFGA